MCLACGCESLQHNTSTQQIKRNHELFSDACQLSRRAHSVVHSDAADWFTPPSDMNWEEDA